jgi:probable HAF family extracellular repeat protein
MKRYALVAVAALVVAFPWLTTVRADAPLYTVQNLGTYNGQVPTITGINASGQVVGNVSTFGSMAVRYTDADGWKALPGLDTAFSSVMGINASGDVVGYHFAAGGVRAFRYRNGTVEDIAPLPGGSSTLGFAINDDSVVTGYADTLSGEIVPFVAAGTTAVALPTLNGGFAYGCGINANGQVAGISVTSSGAQHGTRVDAGATAPIDIASPDGNTQTVNACAIDAAGHVGGQMGRSSGASHAFRYSDAGGVLDLDTFNSPLSNIESIAAGVSAGWYTLADGVTLHAFAHRDADGSFDLNTRIDAPGWVLSAAKAINESGAIAGEGTFNGASAVFRLTAQEATDTTPPVIGSVTASPSSIFPPKGQTVPVTIAVSATDDSGQAPACSITSIAGPGSAPADFNITGALTGTVLAVGGRTYTFNVKCADAANNSAAGSAAVFVVPDTTAPVISSVSAAPNDLWPPDNRLVPVKLSVAVSDDVDASPVCALNGVSGVVAADDATITGPLAVTLRAAGGRVYNLNVRCADAAGNASTASATVVVPADVTGPTVTALSATPAAIWPANGKFVPVKVSVSATDDVDASPVCTLTGVAGGPASDAVVTGSFTANVRATRNADGSVRTYTFNISCRDNAGNASLAAVTVSVSKDGASKVYHYNRRLRRFLEGLEHRRDGHEHDRR